MTAPTTGSAATNGGTGFWLFDADITATAARWLKAGLWVRAILSVVLGIVVLVLAFNNPDAIAYTIATLFAVYFWIIGLMRIVQGIVSRDSSGGLRALGIILGVLLIVAGVVAIRNPVVSLIALALVIGFSWIVEGVLAVMETAQDSSKWFGTILGVISVVAGITVIFLPLESIGILVLFAGISLIITGVFAAMTAFTLGKAPKAAR
ncbi:HdeD family acid-resistance protein [Herbiconiux liangxiaofengii]|uniref:HdeD family acid-resistance protein n=1 Tax=Herbiconiux liangxiaofengii TaxID=3342795 RepID=UPI0035BA7302